MRLATFLRVGPSAVVAVLAVAVACVEAASGPNAATRDREPRRAVEAAPQRPQFVAAPAGDVRSVVAEATGQAASEACTLLVYIGATWCEPCQAFHQAVERGELDGVLANVRFLEFDSDVDGDRLRTAGYDGRLIPRFTVPNADGSPSSTSIEGGIKGEGAVQNIVERLGPLLAPSRVR